MAKSEEYYLYEKIITPKTDDRYLMYYGYKAIMLMMVISFSFNEATKAEPLIKSL